VRLQLCFELLLDPTRERCDVARVRSVRGSAKPPRQHERAVVIVRQRHQRRVALHV
jgi:hypothetical protein